jgi:hypothetical protein
LNHTEHKLTKQQIKRRREKRIFQNRRFSGKIRG